MTIWYRTFDGNMHTAIGMYSVFCDNISQVSHVYINAVLYGVPYCVLIIPGKSQDTRVGHWDFSHLR